MTLLHSWTVPETPLYEPLIIMGYTFIFQQFSWFKRNQNLYKLFLCNTGNSTVQHFPLSFLLVSVLKRCDCTGLAMYTLLSLCLCFLVLSVILADLLGDSFFLSFFRFKGNITKGGKQHRTFYLPGANIFRLSCGNGFCLLELSQA